MSNGGVLSAILSDQPDDVLAEMKRQLEKRIADARTMLTQSENELRLVEQALAARDPVATGGSPGDADLEREREPDGRFQGIPRATILAVATTLPEPITPAGVVEAFAERGETVNIEQIRIALSRIAKDGNLTKIGPSQFVAPVTHAPEPTAPRESTPNPDVVETEPGADPFRWGVLGASVNRDVFRRGS